MYSLNRPPMTGFRRIRSASGPGVPLDLPGSVQAQPAELDRVAGRGADTRPLEPCGWPQVTLISDLVPSPARAAGVHARSVTVYARPVRGQRGPALQRAARPARSPQGERNLMNHNAGWALQRSMPGRHNGRRVRRRVPRGYTRGPDPGTSDDLLRSGRRPDEPSVEQAVRVNRWLRPDSVRRVPHRSLPAPHCYRKAQVSTRIVFSSPTGSLPGPAARPCRRRDS